MVSNARLLFPDPDRPVMTVSDSRGISTSIPLRLCSRAPRTEMWVSIRRISFRLCSEATRGGFPGQRDRLKMGAGSLWCNGLGIAAAAHKLRRQGAAHMDARTSAAAKARGRFRLPERLAGITGSALIAYRLIWVACALLVLATI